VGVRDTGGRAVQKKRGEFDELPVAQRESSPPVPALHPWEYIQAEKIRLNPSLSLELRLKRLRESKDQMENSSRFTRPDVINLVLIVLLAAIMTIHITASMNNHTLIASQEAKHISMVSTQLKALQNEVQQLKAKSVTATN
jgi:hypothetical protein